MSSTCRQCTRKPESEGAPDEYCRSCQPASTRRPAGSHFRFEAPDCDRFRGLPDDRAWYPLCTAAGQRRGVDKAKAELAVIVELLTKKQAIAQKVSELKASSEITCEQARSDVESRIAELEKSVQAIEAKFKAA